MSKKPIEQQVAELTPEQKSKMGKIYKGYLIATISVLLASVIAIVVLYSGASIRCEQAKEKYDRLEAQSLYNINLFDERMEAMDAYYDAKIDKGVALMIGGGIGSVCLLAVAIFVKVKYPYFSEKKYTYLKKQQKNSVQ